MKHDGETAHQGFLFAIFSEMQLMELILQNARNRLAILHDSISSPLDSFPPEAPTAPLKS
jgi:hypothetical protein